MFFISIVIHLPNPFFISNGHTSIDTTNGINHVKAPSEEEIENDFKIIFKKMAILGNYYTVINTIYDKHYKQIVFNTVPKLEQNYMNFNLATPNLSIPSNINNYSYMLNKLKELVPTPKGQITNYKKLIELAKQNKSFEGVFAKVVGMNIWDPTSRVTINNEIISVQQVTRDLLQNLKLVTDQFNKLKANGQITNIRIIDDILDGFSSEDKYYINELRKQVIKSDDTTSDPNNGEKSIKNMFVTMSTATHVVNSKNRCETPPTAATESRNSSPGLPINDSDFLDGELSYAAKELSHEIEGIIRKFTNSPLLIKNIGQMDKFKNALLNFKPNNEEERSTLAAILDQLLESLTKEISLTNSDAIEFTMPESSIINKQIELDQDNKTYKALAMLISNMTAFRMECCHKTPIAPKPIAPKKEGFFKRLFSTAKTDEKTEAKAQRVHTDFDEVYPKIILSEDPVMNHNIEITRKTLISGIGLDVGREMNRMIISGLVDRPISLFSLFRRFLMNKDNKLPKMETARLDSSLVNKFIESLETTIADKIKLNSMIKNSRIINDDNYYRLKALRLLSGVWQASFFYPAHQLNNWHKSSGSLNITKHQDFSIISPENAGSFHINLDNMTVTTKRSAKISILPKKASGTLMKILPLMVEGVLNCNNQEDASKFTYNYYKLNTGDPNIEMLVRTAVDAIKQK